MKATLMAKEAQQAPAVIAEQLKKNTQICQQIADTLRANSPHFVYIIGRGSSDHAGVFAKYLIETEMGIPVCSAAPSVTSLFKRELHLKQALVLCISQSGRSPDILTQVESAKRSGATCIALVNDVTSPLANIATSVIPLHAGNESAVAATKSYLATISALLHLVALWAKSSDIVTGLKKLPQSLTDHITQAPQLKYAFIKPFNNCVVLGRGFGYAIAKEIALKLKEVCGIHAESFSSAEFLHGPATLVSSNFAIIDIDIEDESSAAHRAQIQEMKKRGAQILQLSNNDCDLHPRVLPLLIMFRFYLDVEKVSVAMGLNPDAPIGLKKVTQTI